MQQVRVKKQELLVTLRKNRADHYKVFVEALEGYRVEAIALLEKSLLDAKAGKRIRQTISFTEPINQTKEYDRTIGMLEMSVDEEVVLSSNEYQNYVMDIWSWSGQFLMANAKYSKTLQDNNPDFSNFSE